MGILGVLSKLFKAIADLTLALKANTKVLRLKQPGLVFLTLTNEVDEMLFFKLMLPAPGASDVVTRKLSVQIAGGTPTEIDLAIGDAVPEMSGNDNDVVEGSLIDIDDANNFSPPSNFSFILTDTIAPPAPGQVGLEVTREE